MDTSHFTESPLPTYFTGNIIGNIKGNSTEYGKFWKDLTGITVERKNKSKFDQFLLFRIKEP